MLTWYIEGILHRYGGLLSDDGRRAFIAKCVRKGYSDALHLRKIALEFFEETDIDEAARVLREGVRSVDVAAALAVLPKKRAKVGRLQQYEARGDFSSAWLLAEKRKDAVRARMYESLDRIVSEGPLFDEGYLRDAALLLDSFDEEGAKENAQYLRRLADFSTSIRKKTDYDFA